MMAPIKQFVPSSVCLQCDGCCRFKSSDSPWRPKLGVSEEKSLAQMITDQEWHDDDGHIRTLCHLGQEICRFFNPQDHTCAVYQNRPFECAVYPFLLSKSSVGVDVYVHLSCPYVQDTQATVQFEEYIVYLKNYFHSAEVLDFLKRNSRMVHDYSAFLMEMQFLFTIEKLRV